MSRVRFLWLAALAACAVPGRVAAQEPPPPIPLVAIDVRGTVPKFNTEQALASSRDLRISQLPSRGLGAELGLHVYLFKVKAMTVGVGGQVTLARGVVAPQTDTTGAVLLRGVTERFRAATPQLSFNFGDGEGWSYISGGLGLAQRVILPDGADLSPNDEERLRVVNYGGGARWFIKPHVAFTFDVRFHDIDPGAGPSSLPATPRSRLLIMGRGSPSNSLRDSGIGNRASGFGSRAVRSRAMPNGKPR